MNLDVHETKIKLVEQQIQRLTIDIDEMQKKLDYLHHRLSKLYAQSDAIQNQAENNLHESF